MNLLTVDDTRQSTSSTVSSERLDMNIIQKVDGERIGQYAQRLMTSTDLKNPAILDQIGKQFPEAKTTMACIAWYRSDLKKKGMVAQPVQQEVERTMEVIEAELAEAQAKVEELGEELASLKQAQEEELLAQEEELKERLEQIKKLKALNKKEEKKEEEAKQ